MNAASISELQKKIPPSLVRAWKVAGMVIGKFIDDQCLIRASSLAFTFILSLVPAFAVTFSILKGLGVQNRLEPFVLQQVAAGQEEIVSRVVGYINNTEMGTLGAFGVAGIFLTALSLIASIEDAFNAIWKVTQSRTLHRRFSDYLSVMVAGPLLLLTAVSLTTTLQSQFAIRWLVEHRTFGPYVITLLSFLPYVAMWIALGFLYTVLPNTRVRFESALLGAIVAGTGWQSAQWGYVTFQVGVSKYNAIYGAMAVLPIFMAWIYIGWIIILFGMEIVYAHQNRVALLASLERQGHPEAPAGEETLALAICALIAGAFRAGRKPWSLEKLSEELKVSPEGVGGMLERLCTVGILVPVAGDEPLFQPARSPQMITAAEILRTARGEEGLFLDNAPEQVRETVKRWGEAGSAAVEGVTMDSLAAEWRQR